MDLTREQRAAVENRGGDLLVAAAAGSGKTRVLVERLMNWVETGEDIDRFLVITFTNAAAAELRGRIAAAIHALLAKRPGDAHLRRNATLVYKAPICTIDAFCLDFLRQWGHLIDLDPDFRLCDEAEADELRARALEEVLEGRYANIQNDPAFAALADELAGERDDQTLEEVILDVHRRVQAQTDPRGWLLDRRKDFALPAGAMPEDTPWGRLRRPLAHRLLAGDPGRPSVRGQLRRDVGEKLGGLPGRHPGRPGGPLRRAGPGLGRGRRPLPRPLPPDRDEEGGLR